MANAIITDYAAKNLHIGNASAIVYYIPLPNTVDGAIKQIHENKYVIVINSDKPMCIQEKALKHEISHITNNDFYKPGCSVDQIEFEAHTHI